MAALPSRDLGAIEPRDLRATEIASRHPRATQFATGTVGIHQGVARTILPFLEGHAGRHLPVPIMEPVGPCP